MVVGGGVCGGGGGCGGVVVRFSLTGGNGELLALEIPPTNQRKLPAPAPYTRAHRHGRQTYTSPTEALRRRAYTAALLPPPPHRLTGPVAVVLHIVHPRPKALRHGPRVRIPSARMDADNVAKLVLDVVTRSGLWWRDDSEVAALHVEAWYAASDEPAHVAFGAMTIPGSLC